MQAPKFLRIASDLHLEWRREEYSSEKILPYDERDTSSFLILAGDIGSGKPLKKFLEEVSHRFERTIYIPGNHEYYGSQGYDKANSAMIKAFAEIPTLDFAIGETRFALWGDFTYIFTTMWTDCDKGDPLAIQAIQQGMSDFRAIPNFSATKTIRLHEKAKKEIESFLKLSESIGKKSIVITHHMPSHALIRPKYKQPGWDEINGGFAAHCDDLIGNSWSPALWIFGHTHDKINETLGNTLFVSNPRGYPNEPTGFEERDFINLKDLS